MKLNKLTKILIICFSFATLITASEIIYSRKDPKLVTYTISEIAKYFAKNNNFKAALSTFFWGANFVVNSNKIKYPKIIPSNYKSYPPRPQGNKLKKDFEIILADLDNKTIYHSTTYDYSLILYEMALMAYNNNEPVIFPQLVEMSFYMRPTLSYWPVELANYYYRTGENDKAISILEKCKILPEPRNHCSYFIEYINSGSESFDPGFLKNDAYKFYRLEQHPKPFN